MKRGALPADDHIVRYVKPSMIQEDGTADGSDFRLRPDRPDEEGLSVNWLEAFPPGKSRQLNEIRRLCRLRLRPNERLAEMNVGKIMSEVAAELDTLHIVHDPLEATEEFDADPSHAEIRGLPPGAADHAAVGGDPIVECVVDMHPAEVRRDD